MADATHNSKLSADDRRKLFAHYFRKELAEATVQRESAERKKANRKIAKASDPTFTGQKFDHYLKAHFGEDDQKPVDRLRSDRENLEWLGLIPQTSQGDLLAQADRVDKEGMIRAKGFEAGLLNMPRQSGFDGGSSDDRMWLDSYDAGAEEYKTDIPDILARAEAARTKEEKAPVTEGGSDPFAAAKEGAEPVKEAAE